jgi:hypothetical protein
MWFFISDNFDLKIETLILLDKIQMGSFKQRDLEKFIASTESQMLKDMNQSNVTEEQTQDQIQLGESIKFDEDDLYKTVKLDQYGTDRNRTGGMFRKTGTANFGESDHFDRMSSREKKEWLLQKIMELKISSNVQNQLVDRIEAIMMMEEEKRQQVEKEVEVLHDKVRGLKQRKSQNATDEVKILQQLENRENQVIALETEYKTTREKLMKLEKEKSRMEENFVSEVLGLQTNLDQKLLQIQSLDKRNKELAEAKTDLEEMVEEYKKYSETCKQRTREVEDEKNGQIRDLKKEMDWVKSKYEDNKETLLKNIEVEKLALEETIKELMFKNKVRVTRTCKRTSTT